MAGEIFCQQVFEHERDIIFDMNDWMIILCEGLAITVLGSILHFVYAWSKQNKFVAIFAAVNESTWEHIKLALSGIFVCTLVDMWWLGDNSNYWFAKSLSFLTPVIVIPALFYGYRAILKVKSCLPIDIGLFVVASFASSGVFVWALRLPSLGPAGEIVSIVISMVIIAMYLSLTRFPLHNFLFRDPITGKYGYEKRKARRI